MTSTTTTGEAPTTVPALVRAVDDLAAAARRVSGAFAADPTLLAELPDELLARLSRDLHLAADASTASATVVTGRLERDVGSVRGKLVADRYPTTARFLEREVGMSSAQARAAVARGRDLDTHSTRVADSWLAGEIRGAVVRDLTVGVTDVLRRSTRTDTPIARDEALDRLLPLARTRDADRVHRMVGELRLRIDPDGTTEEALFAFENQTLSIVDAGTMFRISGWLCPEAAVAARTVLEAGARQITEQQLGGVEHDHECESQQVPDAGCSCGAVDRARRASGLRRDRAMALAFGELVRDHLDDAELGSHHRVAPHITVVVDATDVVGPLVGRVTVPGSDDDVLVGEGPLNRLLCDADVSRVVTTAAAVPGDAGGSTTVGAATVLLDAVMASLEALARSVLYVGRQQRTVSAGMRRALLVRDDHCVFPGCRARAARCHAHHVLPWQHGGATDLPNLALLCVTHHVAVHEGGWSMRLRPGLTGREQDCWEFSLPVGPARRPARP